MEAVEGGGHRAGDKAQRCSEAVGFSSRCENLTQSASSADYEQRQAFRRRLVNMFHRATDYAG